VRTHNASFSKKYQKPTTHRLLERQVKPPLLAGELSILFVSSGTTRSLGWFPILLALVGPITKMAGKIGLPS
jgi:hypothetical protein